MFQLIIPFLSTNIVDKEQIVFVCIGFCAGIVPDMESELFFKILFEFFFERQPIICGNRIMRSLDINGDKKGEKDEMIGDS